MSPSVRRLLESPAITRVLCCLPLYAALANGAVASEPELPFRQTRLELRLRLDYEEGSLAGLARIGFVNDSESPATDLPFNLNRLMAVRSARGPDGALPFVQDVVAFTDFALRQVDHVTVTLPRPLAPGAATWIELDYGGHLVGYTETGSLYIRDRIDRSFTILRTDALAFPELGTLSMAANRRAPRGDFDFRIEIDVPEGLVVASAGLLEGVRSADGRSVWSYRSAAPVPFLNVPIAPYETLDEDGVRIFHFPADREGAERLAVRARRALAQLRDWLGPPVADSTVTILEIPEGWGSQASLTGGIIQTADVFATGADLAPLYHELSHLWNAPDLDRPSARWNEGLATWFQGLLAERLDGWTGRSELLERAADRLLERIDASSSRDVPFADYGKHGLTDWSYRTGLLFFYTLERTMGEEALIGALRGHFQAHKRAGTTFADLERALERASAVDLGPLLEDWVHTTGWQPRVRARTSLAAVADSYRAATP